MNKTTYIIITIILIFIITEILLRFIGFSPKVFNQKFISKPEISFVPDSLGISLKNGKYKININNCIEFVATHNSEGRRITSKINNVHKNKIFIYGCSYAYGFGINDEKTYPYLLQNLLNNHEIYNYAVPGSGTIQSFLKLKKTLEKGERPKIVVISYATFHEERNQLTRSYESKLFEGIKYNKGLVLSKYYYPRCTIKNNDIEIEYIDIVKDFYPVPMVKFSAISYFINQIWNNISKKNTVGFPVTKKIFIDLQKLAFQYGFKLIIADVLNIRKSSEIKTFCFENNLNYVNLFPNYSEESFSLAPCDLHPNYKAHEIYAKNLYEYIIKLM